MKLAGKRIPESPTMKSVKIILDEAYSWPDSNSNDKSDESLNFEISAPLSIQLTRPSPTFEPLSESSVASQTSSDECQINLPVATPAVGSHEVLVYNNEIIEGIAIPSNRKNRRKIWILSVGVVCTIIILVSIVIVASRKQKPSTREDPEDATMQPSSSPTLSMSPTTSNRAFLKELFIPISGEEVLNDPSSVQYFALESFSFRLDNLIATGAISNSTEDLIQRYVMSIARLSLVKNLDAYKPLLRSQKWPHLCELYKCNNESQIQVIESRNQWSAGLGGGTLAREFGELKGLTHIVVFGGKIRGTIPTEIGLLKNLEYLDLHENLLSGTIPTEIGQLRNLRMINLHSNMLTGTMPSEIGNVSGLSFFNMSRNLLKGSIPAEFDNLNNLEVFSVKNNNIGGSVELLCDNDFEESGNYYEEMDIKSQLPYIISGQLGLFIDCDKMDECSCCSCG